MVQYSPKALFRQNEGDCIKWSAIASDSLTHKAIAHAQAAMVQGGFGPEHMKGVTTFIGVLLNLAEKPTPNPALPVKKLTGDDPQKPMPAEPTAK